MPESCSPEFVTLGGELPLANQGHLELLRTMMERGLPLRMRVRGLSMMPFIRDNDVVTVEPLTARAPRVGEVVAFVSPGKRRLALHRVVAKQGTDWCMRGDSSLKGDGTVPREDVLGRVVRVEHDGHVVRFGAGIGGMVISWLSRHGCMQAFRRFRLLIRRPVSLVLRGSRPG